MSSAAALRGLGRYQQAQRHDEERQERRVLVHVTIGEHLGLLDVSLIGVRHGLLVH